MPIRLSFGTQTVGTTSGQLTAVLTNNYTSALTVSSISVGGTNPGDFAETDNCPKTSGGFAAGASCTLTVKFTPSISNFESAKIVVNDSANNTPQTVYVNGTGIVSQGP